MNYFGLIWFAAFRKNFLEFLNYSVNLSSSFSELINHEIYFLKIFSNKFFRYFYDLNLQHRIKKLLIFDIREYFYLIIKSFKELLCIDSKEIYCV